MQYKIKLLGQIVKYYNLINRKRVTLELLENISLELKISLPDLAVLLGISNYSFYNLKKGFQKTTFLNLDKNINSVKEIVNLIKIELRYLPQYGSRYYKKSQLKYICTKKEITIYELLQYIDSNSKRYKFNVLSFKNNQKGFWIGQNIGLKEEFVNENYDKLMKISKRGAYKICERYNCYGYLEEFTDIAFDKIIETGGIVEKNFIFDKVLQFNILGAKGKYAIINYYHKYCKDLQYEQILQDKDIAEDRMEILADNKYNPEKILEEKFEEEKLFSMYNSNDFYIKIIEEINRNLELFEIDRELALKKIADNLEVSLIYLHQKIDQMQKIYLKNKIDKFF